MTNTIWSNAVSDDWASAADWSAGVPTASEDAIINAKGAYTVAISSADIAHSLTIDAAGATLQEDSGGSLTLKGRLTLDAGTVILDGANSFTGQTRLIGGTLEIGNAQALGSSGLTIDGGVLIGAGRTTFSNEIDANGTSILAAAHNDTFTFAGQAVFNMNSGGTIEFGQAGDDGTFVWDPLTLGVANSGGGFNVSVNAGILRDGNGSLSQVLGVASSTTIASGAKLDIHGNAETIADLNGTGIVTSTVSGGSLTVDDGDFAGSIAGALALTVSGSLTLRGANTFKDGTTIDSGATINLANGASLSGHILDNGALYFTGALNNPFVLNGGISGTGTVSYGFSSGTVILDGANHYSGDTIVGRTIEVGHAGVFGTSQVHLEGGELIGTTDVSLSNRFVIDGNETFAAAPGTTLTLKSGKGWTLNTNGDLTFGDSTNDGVVVWDASTGLNGFSFQHGIVVQDGTLRAGDTRLNLLLTKFNYHIQNVIGQNGTLDVGGYANTLSYITGNGTIENSGAHTTITLSKSDFSGAFSGDFTLDIKGRTTLSGAAANWSVFNLLPNSNLILDGSSSSDVIFSTGHESVTLGGFTGRIVGFSSDNYIFVPSTNKHLAVSYSGDAAGGTLTVADSAGSEHITMVGDYTNGTFFIVSGSRHSDSYVYFTPNPLVAAKTATASADRFDFKNMTVPHTVTEADVAHLHGMQAANEIAFVPDVTVPTHVHDAMLDHFAHGLFAHGHGFAEALL